MYMYIYIYITKWSGVDVHYVYSTSHKSLHKLRVAGNRAIVSNMHNICKDVPEYMQFLSHITCVCAYFESV